MTDPAAPRALVEGEPRQPTVPPEWNLTMRERQIYEAGYYRGGAQALRELTPKPAALVESAVPVSVSQQVWYPCACGAEHNTPTCPFGAASVSVSDPPVQGAVMSGHALTIKSASCVIGECAGCPGIFSGSTAGDWTCGCACHRASVPSAAPQEKSQRVWELETKVQELTARLEVARSTYASVPSAAPPHDLETLIADFEEAARSKPSQRGTCWTCGMDFNNEQRLSRALVTLTLQRLRAVQAALASPAASASPEPRITSKQLPNGNVFVSDDAPQAASASPAPRDEWRVDDNGALDDVVVEDVQMFRLERMSHDHIWGAVYRRDGSRTTFQIYGNRGARVSLDYEHERPLPSSPDAPRPVDHVRDGTQLINECGGKETKTDDEKIHARGGTTGDPQNLLPHRNEGDT